MFEVLLIRDGSVIKREVFPPSLNDNIFFQLFCQEKEMPLEEILIELFLTRCFKGDLRIGDRLLTGEYVRTIVETEKPGDF